MRGRIRRISTIGRIFILFENMKEISIIIPIFNVEKFVAECLNSVISQTYDHSKIECIVVDDCTPDKSMDIVNEIIGEYKGEMTFITRRHKENEGLSAARNTGISIATGEYLYFLDSDDYIYPNSLELLMEGIGKNIDIDMVVGNFFDERINKPQMNIHNNEIIKSIDLLYFGKMEKKSACNNLIKRKLFSMNNLRFPIGRYYEDIVLNYELFSYVNKVYVVSQCTYFYRDNLNGIIRKQSMEKLQKSIDDYLFALDFFISNLNENLCVGKTAIIVNTYFFTYEMFVKNRSDLKNVLFIEERLKYIRHSLIKILVKKFRVLLFFLSLSTLPKLTEFILNNGFMRRKIFYINCFFLYSALWADKLHFSNKKQSVLSF